MKFESNQTVLNWFALYKVASRDLHLVAASEIA